MTNFNFLSKSSGQSMGHSSVTLASTVGSPSAHRRGTMLKHMTFVLLFLFVGIGNAWGTSSVTTGTYTKQSSVAVTENGSYIFLFGTTSSAYAMTNANNSGSSNYVARSSEYKSLPNSITITNDNKNLVWVVSNYNNGSFKLDGPNGYCYCQGTGKLAVNSSSSSTWHIGTTSNVIYLIDANNCYVKNTGTSGFRAYNTTSNRTQLVAIYKLEASYTITAVPNNELWGTVSGTSTITAIPEDGYRVKAGNEGYTVTSGSATVTNNGDNTFSVSTTENCTIQINFEEIPTHTVTWSANGNTNNTSEVAEGSAIEFPESASGCTGKTFVGWVAEPIVGETDDEPTYVTSANMGTSNITYYAVFADAEEGDPVPATLQFTYSSHDGWTLGGNYTNMSSDSYYRLNSVSENMGYIESPIISDLTTITSIDVEAAYYGGSNYGKFSVYGGNTQYGSLQSPSSNSKSKYTLKPSPNPLTGSGKIKVICSGTQYDNAKGTRLYTITIKYTTGGTTYSNYATSCCLPLAPIKGSFS